MQREYARFWRQYQDSQILFRYSEMNSGPSANIWINQDS